MTLTFVHVCSSTVVFGVIDFNFELIFSSKTYFHIVHIFNFLLIRKILAINQNKCT